MMNSGIQLKSGEVVLTYVQFADSFDIKIRPAVILFIQYDNVIVAGITSNTKMKGISITKEEGMPKDSVIKTNYIFTTSTKFIKKSICHLSKTKRKKVFDTLCENMKELIR